MSTFVYNTTRNKLVIKEYGRNIQKMVEKALEIEDHEERSEEIKAIIKVMAHINPENKENEKLEVESRQKELEAYWHKLWDHLFIISNYQLEANSPFDKPVPLEKGEQIKKHTYKKGTIANRSYGRNMENMIKQVSEYPEHERSVIAPVIANHLKKIYLTHNKKSVDDEIIIHQLESLSDGKLTLSEDATLESTRSILKANNACMLTCGSDSFKKKNSTVSRKRRSRKHKM